MDGGRRGDAFGVAARPQNPPYSAGVVLTATGRW